jgi:hypothetical protein
MRRLVLLSVLMRAFAGCGGSGGVGGASSRSPTTPATPTATNTPPVIATVTATPSFGVSSLTLFNVVASASNPGGDALTHEWKIAGNSASGANAGHYSCGNKEYT